MKKFAVTFLMGLFMFSVPTFANPVAGVTKGTVFSVIEEDEESYKIQIPVTGFSASDMQATIKDNVLTITTSTPKSNDKIIQGNFKLTPFTRKIILKKGATVDKLTVISGVLVVELTLSLPDNLKTKKLNIR